MANEIGNGKLCVGLVSLLIKYSTTTKLTLLVDIDGERVSSKGCAETITGLISGTYDKLMTTAEKI